MDYELLTTVRLSMGGVEFEAWDAGSFAEGVRAAWGQIEKTRWPPAWMTYQRSARPRSVQREPLAAYDELACVWWQVTTAGTPRRPLAVCGPDDDFDVLWDIVERHVTDRARLRGCVVRASAPLYTEDSDA